MASSEKNQSLKPFKNGGLFFILRQTHDNIKEMHLLQRLLTFIFFHYRKDKLYPIIQNQCLILPFFSKFQITLTVEQDSLTN